MRMKIFSLVAASVALAATPVVAQAQSADRAAAPVSSEQELGGGSDGLIAAIAIAVLAAFIYFTVDDDDLDPVSV